MKYILVGFIRATEIFWTCEVLHSAYILHFHWLDAHKNALEFQLVEILNFEPVKLVHIAYCMRLISNVQYQVSGIVQFIEHCRCVVVHMNNAGPPPIFFSSCFPSWTQEWGWHYHSCCRWSWWLYCRRPTGYSVWYCSHRHPRWQEFKHTCTRPTTTTLNPLFLVVYRSIVCICTIKVVDVAYIWVVVVGTQTLNFRFMIRVHIWVSTRTCMIRNGLTRDASVITRD